MPKLADRFLASLEIAEGRKDRLVFDTACPGLGVRLTARGTRTFLAQWTDPATRRKVREPLGVWGNITIDQAREAARVGLGTVAKGINPRTERVRQRAEAERERVEAALTFDALVAEWVALHLAQRRERYRTEAVRAIRYAFPHLLKRPAARITRADAVNALDKLVRAGTAAMAGRTLAYARAAFQWAEKRGKVPHNPFLGLPIMTAAGLGAGSERRRTGRSVVRRKHYRLSIWPVLQARDFDDAAARGSCRDSLVDFRRSGRVDCSWVQDGKWPTARRASVGSRPMKSCSSIPRIEAAISSSARLAGRRFLGSRKRR